MSDHLSTQHPSAVAQRVLLLALAGLLFSLCCTLKTSAETAVFLMDTPKPEPVEPLSDEQVSKSVQRGVSFLLSDQNRNGSWGSATTTKNYNIYAPIPGAHHAFRAACTGLAVSALLQARDRLPEDDQELVDESVLRAADWFEQHLPRVKRATGDAIYNVWAHSFSMEGLVELIKWHDAPSERPEVWRQLIRDQIDLLSRFESVDKGWGYYDFRAQAKQPSGNPTSFTTATVLTALHAAKQVGIEIPERLVSDGKDLICLTRKPDFSYYYSYSGVTKNSPMRTINRPGGSLGRTQACNHALRLWDDPEITDEVLNVWLDRLFARNLWLDIGRKRPIAHEAYFQVAGYFYYYGHWYAARSFDLLPAEDRQRHAMQMSHLICGHQEKDGSWFDFPFYAYHRPYGTAMAVMTLVQCLPVDGGD